jgi:hypothetical protein
VEAILQGNVLWHDPLGYGGRTIIISPLFDAILAIFGLFVPVPIMLKIVPNIFAALLVIPAYLIAHKLTKHTAISLFISLLASLVPAFFSNTFNHATPLTLALPLFFMLTYIWLETPKFTWVMLFLSLLVIFVFLHPLSILFVLSIGVYISLLAIERINGNAAEYELGLFSIFFALWAQFLIYKKLILFHGPSVIWQNIPKELLSAFYENFTILGAITQIGVFPLVDGTYALYKNAFKKPQKEILLLLSITIISAIMIWFKLIDLSTGFMLLGITLALAFSKGLLSLIGFIKQTKFTRYTWAFVLFTVISAVITTAYPAYDATVRQLGQTITQEEVDALTELGATIPEEAIIIAPSQYGNYVTAFTHRKNVIDEYFFLQPRINERYQDITRLYKTAFETEAVELFDKYSATHLIVPPGTKDIKYADNQCFKRIHATNIRIYEKNPECKVKVIA